MSWDVYHIENYLLDNEIIAETANSLTLVDKHTPTEIDEKLRAAARKVVPSMLVHQMRLHVNSKIVQSISLNFSPETLTIGTALYEAANKSASKINDLAKNSLSEKALIDLEQSMRAEFEKCFADGTWRTNLPGREILKRFIEEAKLGVGYEVFRNLLVKRMTEASHQPPGMKAILTKIIKD